MTDRPEVYELLRVARDTLLKEILPHLGEAQKYPALMVANVLAIAGREFQDRDPGQRETIDLLARYYETDILGESNAGPAQAAALQRRLAKDIRAGHLDAQAESLRAALLEQVRARLRISNPKYLAMAEPEQDPAGKAEN